METRADLQVGTLVLVDVRRGIPQARTQHPGTLWLVVVVIGLLQASVMVFPGDPV
jgi:hypothetical protein